MLTMLNEFLETSTTIRLQQLGPIAAPPGLFCAFIAVSQCFAIVGSYAQETSNPTEYSKFASGKELSDPIPTQNGMFRIYVPSTIAAALIAAYQYCVAGEGVFSLAASPMFTLFETLPGSCLCTPLFGDHAEGQCQYDWNPLHCVYCVGGVDGNSPCRITIRADASDRFDSLCYRRSR